MSGQPPVSGQQGDTPQRQRLEQTQRRQTHRRRRALIALIVVALLVGGAAVAVRTLYRSATSTRAEQCDFGSFSIDNGQASVAAQMVAEVITRGLPERASVLVLAAAMQESKLRNLTGGDRDSVGVLQQRPSQGWGTVAQISDIRYATSKFLDALVKITDWQNGDLADTIQAVQISADGSAYAQHTAMAQALADALTGATAAGIDCAYDQPDATSTPAQLGASIVAELPVNAPQVQAQAIVVPGAGWASAAWLVANAQRFGVTSVSYSGKRWNSAHGWKSDNNASSTEVSASVARV